MLKSNPSMIKAAKAGVVLLAVLQLAGCFSSAPSGRYQQRHDSAPQGYADLAKIPDAVPRVEPRSRGGNKSPYQVRGRTYYVLPSSRGYQAMGTASWYGAKFHGHATSNGEIYNMYAMTAAHKSLPIPTYLRVTNLRNGRQVIVRVNDRGPFHSDRVIDLSYAAAGKLGYVEQGTAEVKLEAIDPAAWQQARLPQRAKPAKPTISKPAGPVYVQVAVFARYAAALQMKQDLQRVVSEPVVIYLDDAVSPQLHKVKVGPFKNRPAAERVQALLAQQRFGRPIIVATQL